MLRYFIRGAFLSLLVAATPVLAQGPADLNTAVAYYAFRDLKAMPVLRNRSIEVGDIMVLDEIEDVIAAGERCYPGLETMREHANGADSARSHHMWTSVEAVAEVSGGADIRGLARADVTLQGIYEDSAAIIFTDVVGILPSPDIQALYAENVEQIDHCTPTLDVLASYRYNHLLVTRVYLGTVSAGFVFNVAGSADVEVAARKLARHLGDVSAQTSAEGGLETVTVDEWAQGVIAVQSSRLDSGELAEAWLLMNENPETVADLERLLEEYLDEEDAGRLEEFSRMIRSFLEELGYAEQTIDDLRRNIFASEGGEEISADDIPDEHWRATAAVAAAMVAVGAT